MDGAISFFPFIQLADLRKTGIRTWGVCRHRHFCLYWNFLSSSSSWKRLNWKEREAREKISLFSPRFQQVLSLVERKKKQKKRQIPKQPQFFAAEQKFLLRTCDQPTWPTLCPEERRWKFTQDKSHSLLQMTSTNNKEKSALFWPAKKTVLTFSF